MEESDQFKANEMYDYGTLSKEKSMVDNLEINTFKQDANKYFIDGRRKIDFMIVYENDPLFEQEKTSNLKGLTGENDFIKNITLTNTNSLKFKNYRQTFLKNLLKIGIEMEEESIKNAKKNLTFLKIHLTWHVICDFAEQLMLHSPLQLQPENKINGSDLFLSFFKIPNIMRLTIPKTPENYYMCQFKQSKLERYIGNEDKEKFFNEKDRQRIAFEILSNTEYGDKCKAQVGIERMVDKNIILASYPLHDGDYVIKKDQNIVENFNSRQILYEYWARWGRWYKYQPLDHIREYFGEKIGIYFAWLGFYTAWLIPVSFVGVIIFCYGIYNMSVNEDIIEICQSKDLYIMCPLCDFGCKFWNLSSICMFKKLSFLFDNPGTVFFSIFVSFWAVSFLEFWKRKTAYLAYHWDCMDFKEEEERPRAEYVAKCNTYEINPITGIKEPYFPKRDRIPRIISGLGVVIMMVCVVIIFIIAVIMYRILITIILNKHPGNEFFRQQANLFASITAAFANLLIIMLLSKVYERLAFVITQWEMHRTQSEFENELIFKVFIFQFVNFYSSSIYIGFIKGKFVGYPGNYSKLFGMRIEECENGDCLIELALNLAVVMIGKQIINNIQELVVPKIKALYQNWKVGKISKNDNKKVWVEDFELIENQGLFEEYLEMVLQFGFITLFVAAFPLAPLFALLNNWIEIRLDAQKFVCEMRRPVAERSQDIGVWFTILDSLAQLAVVSNAFLIAFTSEFLPKELYKYQNNGDLKGFANFTLSFSPANSRDITCRYKDFRDQNGNRTIFYWHLLCIRFAFIIIFEHVVFGICRLIDIIVPDIPESLYVKIKREHYLAKQALADSKII